MEIRKNLAKRNLNATSATRQEHIKTDCPLLQNKKMNCYHKWAMKTTWREDSDSSSSDKEEHAAKCVS